MKILTIARWITHPLLMPLYCLLLFFFSFGVSHEKLAALIPLLLFVFLTMTVFPSAIIYLAKRINWIRNPVKPDRRDTKIIAFTVLLFYLMILKLWYDKMPDLFYLYLFILLALGWLFSFLGNFIYPFYTNSLFWGIILGFYLILLQLGATYSPVLLALLILLPGLASVQEVYEEQTQMGPLYVSYGIGLAIALISGKLIIL